MSECVCAGGVAKPAASSVPTVVGVAVDEGYRLASDIPYYRENEPPCGDADYARERCLLDVYYPENAVGAPVVLYFHGGGLVGFEKHIPDELLRCGIIVVAANYRLSGERARCPDYIQDAAAAAGWTFANIAGYGGDPRRVHVCGVSAGAYLAAMIGMDPRYLAKHGLDNRRFASILSISGQMTTHFQVLVEQKARSAAAGADDSNAAALDFPGRMAIDEYAPLYHIAKDLPPIVLCVGDPALDIPARSEENALMAAALRRIAGHESVRLHQLSGFDHGAIPLPSFALVKKFILDMPGPAPE